MTGLPAYTIHHTGKPAVRGVTRPVHGSVRAIIKSDSEESLHCVYNELVATRLARLVFAPLAEGVLVAGKQKNSYASLMLAATEGYLPDLSPARVAKAAQAYPYQAAGLTVFDIWIGNWDRATNLKAALRSPLHRLFCGFDHSHALLSVEEDPAKSIERLASDDAIVTHHPFYGHVSENNCITWAKRIDGLSEMLLRTACELGEPLNGVSPNMQKALADSLVGRSGRLSDLVKVAYAGKGTK